LELKGLEIGLKGHKRNFPREPLGERGLRTFKEHFVTAEMQDSRRQDSLLQNPAPFAERRLGDFTFPGAGGDEKVPIMFHLSIWTSHIFYRNDQLIPLAHVPVKEQAVQL
jgi:hypothetical protein